MLDSAPVCLDVVHARSCRRISEILAVVHRLMLMRLCHCHDIHIDNFNLFLPHRAHAPLTSEC